MQKADGKATMTGLVLLAASAWVLSAPAWAGEKGLAEVMRKAGFKAKTAHWNATMTQTSEGKTTTSDSKFWISGDKVRIEMQNPETGEAMILIDDGSGLYMVNPKEKLAMKLKGMARENYLRPFESSFGAGVAEQRRNARKIGAEKVLGKSCTVYAYSSKVGGEVKSKVKEWVWNGKEIPLKTMTDTPAQTVTMMGHSTTIPASKSESLVTAITLNKPIADALFTLPKGVKVQNMGMGRAPAPPAAEDAGDEGPPKNMPPEVQEMMKNFF